VKLPGKVPLDQWSGTEGIWVSNKHPFAFEIKYPDIRTQLAKRAGIIRPLSNKTGRHTNAQMWIRLGTDPPVLSKTMGHLKETTTQNYYKVNLREVIDGSKSANFEQFGI